MKPASLASLPVLLSNLLLCARAASAADPVGFNFMNPGDNSILGNFPLSERLASTDVAGVVPQTNWNNLVQGGTGVPPGVLVQDGIRISWATPGGGTHNLPYGTTPGDSLLMRGYLDTGELGTIDTIKVTGVPFPLYDVLCYSKGDNGAATRVGKFTLSSTNNGLLFTNISKYVQDDGSSVFDGSTYLEANSTSGFPNAASGNYCRFYNVRGTNFTILSTPNYGSDGHARSPFNALQIVPIDVSSVLSSPSYGGGQFQCFLNGATNASYVIQASTDFVSWQPVSTNVAPGQVTDMPPPNTPYRFYRAVFQ